MKPSTKQFKILVERDSDGYFTASVPALPGCHTQAKTLSALHERIREAIELCLEVAKEDRDYARNIKSLAYEPTFVGVDVVTLK